MGALLALGIAGPAVAEGPAVEWWVVIGSVPNADAGMGAFAEGERISATARRCGVAVMGDFSAKFEGFASGYYVIVAGGFPTRGAAERALARVRPCVPDAYLRRGRYAGE